MNASWSRLAAVGAGLATGAVFLALAFRGTPAAAVWRALQGGHWGLPALVVLAGTAIFVGAKAARWRLLLGGAPDLTFAALARPVLTGLALNALVPHSGELVRAVALRRGSGRALSAVLSSIVAERVFDMFGVLLLGATALLYVPVSTELASAVRILGGATLVLAGGIVAALALPDAILRLVRTAAAWLPVRARTWLLRQASEAIAGLEPVRSFATSAQALGWSLAQWLAIALCVYGCGRVVGFDATLPGSCLVVVGIVVAFLLPNAPGYAGSVQVAFLVTLRPLGVADTAALAASIAYQLLMVLPTVVVGLALLRATLAHAREPA